MTNRIKTHVCWVSLSDLTGSDAVAYVDGAGDDDLGGDVVQAPGEPGGAPEEPAKSKLL